MLLIMTFISRQRQSEAIARSQYGTKLFPIRHEASIMTRLNQDREGASPFTINSLKPTLKFLCDVELVCIIGNTASGCRCTYKMNKTHALQQLELAVEEQWEKKQQAKKEKKQEAKKRSKCAIAKHVVLVRQAS